MKTIYGIIGCLICSAVIVAPGCGPYDFVLKFYQPATGNYYVSPLHRMELVPIEPSEPEGVFSARISTAE